MIHIHTIPKLMFEIKDAEGTTWTVIRAGPLIPWMMPGQRRHLVFQAGAHRVIVEHDWVNQPLTTTFAHLLLLQAGRDLEDQ